VCDLETSRMGAPYIYIYDISRLRVKFFSTSSSGCICEWITSTCLDCYL